MLSQQQLCKCPAPGSWLGLRVLPEGRGGVAFPGSEGQEASEAACLLSHRRGTPSVGPDCASSGCLPPSRGRKPLKGVTDSWGSPDSGLWAGGGAPCGAEGKPCSPVAMWLETLGAVCIQGLRAASGVGWGGDRGCTPGYLGSISCPPSLKCTGLCS